MTELPADLKQLINAGVWDSFIKMSRKHPICDVRPYETDLIRDSLLVEDQLFEVTAFARNAAGDYWGYVTSELPNGPISLFYHDDPEVERETFRLIDFIFRQTIRLAGYKPLADDAAIEAMRERILRIKKLFADYFEPHHHAELQAILSSPPVLDEKMGLGLISYAKEEEVLRATSISTWPELDWFEG